MNQLEYKQLRNTILVLTKAKAQLTAEQKDILEKCKDIVASYEFLTYGRILTKEVLVRLD